MGRFFDIIIDIVHSSVDQTNIGMYLYGFFWSPKIHVHRYLEYREGRDSSAHWGVYPLFEPWSIIHMCASPSQYILGPLVYCGLVEKRRINIQMYG